ncbi:ATP-binding cassette domain-containing protein [Marinobacter nanhaiticus D15-8W]|uniref:ATP-binding cassette domain-containing protein n=1 Tax=Marinobacter nanhaiticus D15-8W TaxID=626887 RepID=N6X0K3_9GAMM|nr:ATP-binding cassette domain-containing protein [Marinobacter nanhaiticus]ENO16967.1 ATP-binding cassette domain-containing protein [Marinobacter nanhaiticus D15-8W]
MLDVSQLRFRYPDASHSINARRGFDFSFRLGRGECLGVTGPSGCGKSTLLSLLAGFLTPESGRVQWQGEDLLQRPPWERPMTSVFQEHNLFDHLTVHDNLALGLHPGMKLSKSSRKKIPHILHEVGLEGMEKRYPTELSGGQRQRVAVARALLRRTPLLLLDEPFTGLDTETRKGLQDLLLDQKASGATMLLVSHDPGDVRILADRTLELTA